MKRIIAIALFTIATLAAANGLVAQEPGAKANIPFNFTVGEKSMPAGEYTISLTSEHVVKIQSADKQQLDLVVASKSYQEPGAEGQLVFDKVGEYYFLRRISSPIWSSMNLAIPSGKVEKKVQTREAMLRTGEETLVATR
jgi:hypothetical protein